MIKVNFVLNRFDSVALSTIPSDRYASDHEITLFPTPRGDRANVVLYVTESENELDDYELCSRVGLQSDFVVCLEAVD